MTALGPLAFLQPWFLIGLVALPALWWLLRATPPAPKRVRFPGVAVLLGLEDQERTPQRTPLWLLLLRVLAAALLLLAFAQPVMNPAPRLAGSGPLLVVMDGGWGSAAEWSLAREAAADRLSQAGAADRPVAVLSLADPTAFQDLSFGAATAAIAGLEGIEPRPWRPQPEAAPLERLREAVAALAPEGGAPALETIWIHDGLAHPGSEALEEALAALGPLRLIEPATAARALAPPEARGGGLAAVALRAEPGPEETIAVAVLGAPPALLEPDAAGSPGDDDRAEILAEASAGDAGLRRLARVEVVIPEGETRGEAEIALPATLRNAAQRLEIESAGHAGAAQLLDDRWRRRVVAVVSGAATSASQPLLDGAHYLRAALTPHAEAREASLASALGLPDGGGISFGPLDADAGRSWADAIVLDDVGRMDAELEAALSEWVRGGGLLIRFSGPRVAAMAEEGADRFRRDARSAAEAADDLMPTQLRGGGRALSGVLSWSRPQRLRAFPETSPFYGLALSEEVDVARQVLAEPGPDLSDRVWASLEDGTPLVTARSVGDGQVVLFHVTATPAWSRLPVSGLFVEMMGRLAAVAPALNAALGAETSGADAARLWTPEAVMDGFGRLEAAGAAAAPVDGATLAAGASPVAGPGRYVAEAPDGAVVSAAVSALGAGETLAPRAAPPAGVVVETLAGRSETDLKPWLLSAGLLLLLADILAALFVAGRMRPSLGRGGGGAAAALLVAALAVGAGGDAAWAQSSPPPATPVSAETSAGGGDAPVDPAARRAALETVLAYVVTGDPAVDRMSAAGLLGLSFTLFERTAIEPGEAAGVNLETDELAVYAMLYWPITARQADLSETAKRKLNAFMAGGGLVVVDTRDAHQTARGREGPMAPHLKRLLEGLDIPPLAPMRAEHVVNRSYYLLRGAPGRWRDGVVWVAAASDPVASGRDPGLASLEAAANDGVSPVVLGGADWAAAWAVDQQGRPLAPLGRGDAEQREAAFRFGVNLAMYAFTGNYKTDQVHIPVLLERLGN